MRRIFILCAALIAFAGCATSSSVGGRLGGSSKSGGWQDTGSGQGGNEWQDTGTAKPAGRSK